MWNNICQWAINTTPNWKSQASAVALLLKKKSIKGFDSTHFRVIACNPNIYTSLFHWHSSQNFKTRWRDRLINNARLIVADSVYTYWYRYSLRIVGKFFEQALWAKLETSTQRSCPHRNFCAFSRFSPNFPSKFSVISHAIITSLTIFSYSKKRKLHCFQLIRISKPKKKKFWEAQNFEVHFSWLRIERRCCLGVI